MRDRLIRRHPDAARALHRYFDVITALGGEMDRLPKPIRKRDLITAPLRFPRLLRRYRVCAADNWTNARRA